MINLFSTHLIVVSFTVGQSLPFIVTMSIERLLTLSTHKMLVKKKKFSLSIHKFHLSQNFTFPENKLDYTQQTNKCHSYMYHRILWKSKWCNKNNFDPLVIYMAENLKSLFTSTCHAFPRACTTRSSTGRLRWKMCHQ